jgi:hypothetical protein
MLDEPTLPLLLQMLPNIVDFHLHARINWGMLLQNSPSLAWAILTALTSPKIESLHFRGMDIPSYCLSRSPGLKHILLNDLTINEETNSAVAPKVFISHLRLTLWTLNWFARPDCPFDIKHLLKLRACPQHDTAQYTALQTLLNAASNSLLEFEYLPSLTSTSPLNSSIKY